MSRPHLSIVIPAYREASRIGDTLHSVAALLPSLPFTTETIVVDDGSPDRTYAIVRGFARKIESLRLIRLHENRGKGQAVKTGMLEAEGSYVLFMDADNSVSIRQHLLRFLEEAYRGADVVIASIALPGARARQANGAYRSVFSEWSKKLIRFFATPSIGDTQRGFKLFSRKAVEAIFPRQTIERFGFDIELLAIALRQRLRIREIPVDWNNPDGSTVKLADYGKTLVELARIAYNKARGIYGGSAEEEELIEFDALDRREKGKGFIYKGKEFVHHSALSHGETALYTFTQAQKLTLFALATAFVLAVLVSWHSTLVLVVALLTLVYFADLIFNAFLIFRSFRSSPEIAVAEDELQAMKDEDLPLYTVFCPLYREWQVLPQFVRAMEQLDYPAEKLQVVLLLEEDDTETVSRIPAANLPAHFEARVVPHSHPKTKPKAMNYGMQYVKGEFLVIYDAEDMPESDQLKKAVAAFKQLPEDVVCVQAKLNFYNVTQNLLTRLFTAEYSLWFDLILPGLQSIQAPIPLGGTSNHFRVDALKSLDGWDAFNVTEDCDLGMRVAKRGYRTAIIESTTYEEANSRVVNWYKQRSRWIKGYLQTYFVHSRQTASFIGSGGWGTYLAFQSIVGGKITSMFINPFMWVMTIAYFLFRPELGPAIQSFFPGPVLYLAVFSLVVGNALYLYYYMIGCAKRRHYGLVKYAYLVPIYWLGMSVAAWRAVYELVVNPHYWAKTVHGFHLAPEAPAPATATT